MVSTRSLLNSTLTASDIAREQGSEHGMNMLLPPLDQPVFIPSRELENNTQDVQRSTREWKTLETSDDV